MARPYLGTGTFGLSCSFRLRMCQQVIANRAVSDRFNGPEIQPRSWRSATTAGTGSNPAQSKDDPAPAPPKSASPVSRRPSPVGTIDLCSACSGVRSPNSSFAAARGSINSDLRAYNPNPMSFVSVTRLKIRSLRFLPIFVLYALRSARQAEKSPGFLGGTLMRDSYQAFWTVTVWTDSKAMDAYRISGMHKRAMPRLLNWCEEASLVHWTQDSTEVPSWTEAHRRMISGGRPSKVHHPSAAQNAFQVPEPDTIRFSQSMRAAQRSA